MHHFLYVWRVLTAAMLKGWNSETDLHENRSYFPEERKCIVFAPQSRDAEEASVCRFWSNIAENVMNTDTSQELHDFATKLP